jgi:hypothetical protein
MENRKKIGLLIIAAAVIILIIIAVLFLNKKKSDEVNEVPVSVVPTSTVTLPTSGSLVPTSTPGDRPVVREVYDLSKEDPHQLDSNDAAKLATSFVERLGSFSNQSSYGNVTDLKIFMTSDMRDWADKYVAELKAASYSGEYYGITTKVLTTKVLSYDKKAGTSKIEVTTERQEGRADNLSAPFRQNITVELVEKNGEWLVDTAYWEKK